MSRHPEVQSVLIPYTFSFQEAALWLCNHGFVAKKVDPTENFMRFRQWDPSQLHRYRTIVLNNGIRLIVKLKQ